MAVSWYSVDVSIQNGPEVVIMKYYFSVNDATNEVLSFYNYNNIGVNILGPTTLPYPFTSSEYPADNVFFTSTLKFGYTGVNFTDKSLKKRLNN